ncbi:ParB/RepB/Spo0J family partition protein [Streptomyces luteireticuli]|uniref:ParB/RepB/Spo0J family partition protein n=1 Tax=Streptomyces luteireticuli TaxID=173858 RepID=UPI003558FA5F
MSVIEVAGQTMLIPLGLIDRNPDQPRRRFDIAKLNELQAQIAAMGQQQPVVVREVGGRYQLVMGERRWRAMRLIRGQKAIEAKIVELDDMQTFLRSASENLGRADMTILEEAQAYSDLIGYGLAVERIAQMFGKTTDYVGWRMDLLELTTEAAKLVDQGIMKPDFAWHVSRLTPANQKVAVTQYMKGDFTTETEASGFAQALKAAEQQQGFFSEKELTQAEKETQTKERKKARSRVEQMELVAGQLDELAKQTPTDLAVLFEGEVARHVDALDRIHRSVTELRKKLRKAKSISSARTLAVRPDLVVDEEEDAIDESSATASRSADPEEAVPGATAEAEADEGPTEEALEELEALAEEAVAEAAELAA